MHLSSRSLEIFTSIISVSTGDKFKGGKNWRSGTSENSITPNFTISKTNWSYVTFTCFPK